MFKVVGRSLRNALGDIAIRIGRIGSLTAPGLVGSGMPARSEEA